MPRITRAVIRFAGDPLFSGRPDQTAFAEGYRPAVFPLTRSMVRRLNDLDRIVDAEEMHFPPANRLERLKGDRAAQWSVRVNDPFRICFVRDGQDAHEVKIVHYP